ncbi:MAG TPA: type II secretion system F family protein [Candidatus Paceibacterota bacterium]|nr:type II secretion system F family protein [Candidatus Paceibacterota bacterium]
MRFAYRARDKAGKQVEGFVEAADTNAAIAALQQRGFTILSLDEEQKGVLSGDLNRFFQRPKTADVVAFTRQLATLVEAQVPLAQSLRTLAKQSEKPAFSRIIQQVADDVEGGSSLSQAFGKHPKLFSQFFVKIIRSGEVSGRLQQSLLYLADYLERSQAIAGKVRNALAYPAFVIFAMLVVALIMVIYVLPQLLVIFEEAGVSELPLSTRILITVTDFVNSYLVLILGGIILLAAGIWQWSKSEDGRRAIDEYKLRAPLFGKIMRNLYLARIAENMGTLIKSEIAILDALRVTADVVDNHVYTNILLESEEAVRGGGLMSDALKKYPEIPPLMSSMISIGEQTGKMDFMLEHVSTFYRTEADNSIATISTLIEPVLVLVLGVGVAALVSSVLLPLYSLVSAG